MSEFQISISSPLLLVAIAKQLWSQLAISTEMNFSFYGNTETIMKFTLKKKCKWKTLFWANEKNENTSLNPSDVSLCSSNIFPPSIAEAFIFFSKSHELLCGFFSGYKKYFEFCKKVFFFFLFLVVSLTGFLMKSLWRLVESFTSLFFFSPSLLFRQQQNAPKKIKRETKYNLISLQFVALFEVCI